MVDDFLRKAKDFIGGSRNEEREQDTDYRERQGYGVRPASEDPYGDPADEEYSGRGRRSHENRYDDEEEDEYSDRGRRSREDRYDDEEDEQYSGRGRRSRKGRHDDDEDDE